MTAVDLERGSKCATLPSQALLSQLELALKSYGTRVGTATDGKAIATRCYLWLEARNRPAEVLDLGDSCPLLLELFLEVNQHDF